MDFIVTRNFAEVIFFKFSSSLLYFSVCLEKHLEPLLTFLSLSL